MCETGDLRRNLQALLVTWIGPSSDHLDKFSEVILMDKTDNSFSIAAQRLYVDYATGTLAHLDALVFVRAQVKLPVTDGTSKSYLFHIGCHLLRSWERPRATTAVPN